MTTTTPRAAAAAAAEAWVRRFAAGWREPKGPAGFCSHFEAILDPQVRLVQPQIATVVGHESFRRGFVEPIFALIPDLRGEVVRWAASGDVLYLELVLRGTLGGRPIEWTSCDRVLLRDGVAVERVAYFDPTPLVRAILARPRCWPRFLRSRLRQHRYALARGRQRR